MQINHTTQISPVKSLLLHPKYNALTTNHATSIKFGNKENILKIAIAKPINPDIKMMVNIK